MITEVTQWISTAGFQIVIICASAYLIRKFGIMPFEKMIQKFINAEHFDQSDERKRREETLVDIIRKTLSIIIYIVAAMMVLNVLGLDIRPLLASAGIAGVALGFGGQWLIRDIIAGIFIITENQYRIGDSVVLHTSAEPITGSVENITLRLTMLRDMNGRLHNVPNGAIIVATNQSKDFSGINLDITVDYNSDIKKIEDIVNKIGKDIMKEAEWKKKIIESPRFLRVSNIGSRGINIKITGRTKPLEQWAVRGEIRQRILDEFEKNDIKFPKANPLANDESA
jgi:small-conductance mechanosensitive channel